MFDFGIAEVRKKAPGDYGRDSAACVALRDVPPEGYDAMSWPEGNVYGPDPFFWEGDLLLVAINPYFEADKTIGWHFYKPGFYFVVR